jgi:hypothetical protein
VLTLKGDVDHTYMMSDQQVLNTLNYGDLKWQRHQPGRLGILDIKSLQPGTPECVSRRISETANEN